MQGMLTVVVAGSLPSQARAPTLLPVSPNSMHRKEFHDSVVCVEGVGEDVEGEAAARASLRNSALWSDLVILNMLQRLFMSCVALSIYSMLKSGCVADVSSA